MATDRNLSPQSEQKISGEQFSRQRQKDNYSNLEEWLQRELLRRNLQPFPRGKCVDSMLDAIERLECVAANGWVADEVRLAVVQGEFGVIAWKRAAEKLAMQQDVETFRGALASFSSRHQKAATHGAGIERPEAAKARMIIDRYYDRSGHAKWCNDELEEIGQRMLVWQFLSRDEPKGDLTLEKAGFLLLARRSQRWCKVMDRNCVENRAVTLDERDFVGNDLLDKVHGIQGLPRPWVLEVPAELEVEWIKWEDTVRLDYAITQVYRSRKLVDEDNDYTR